MTRSRAETNASATQNGAWECVDINEPRSWLAREYGALPIFWIVSSEPRAWWWICPSSYVFVRNSVANASYSRSVSTIHLGVGMFYDGRFIPLLKFYCNCGPGIYNETINCGNDSANFHTWSPRERPILIESFWIKHYLSYNGSFWSRKLNVIMNVENPKIMRQSIKFLVTRSLNYVNFRGFRIFLI